MTLGQVNRTICDQWQFKPFKSLNYYRSAKYFE